MAAVDPQLAPASTPLQREAASRRHPPVPKHCVVTGGSGFIGQRLVEMLVERGAEHVVSFDVAPKPADAWEHPAIRYVVGDLRDAREVLAACAGAECVFHLGAVVGPYHSTQLYEDVNHKGSLHVIAACKAVGCPKLVMSSSPSTRFDGGDVDGLTEAQLPQIPQRRYLQECVTGRAKSRARRAALHRSPDRSPPHTIPRAPFALPPSNPSRPSCSLPSRRACRVRYARTKALGELAVRAACSDQLRTVAVAPHQVQSAPLLGRAAWFLSLCSLEAVLALCVCVCARARAFCVSLCVNVPVCSWRARACVCDPVRKCVRVLPLLAVSPLPAPRSPAL